LDDTISGKAAFYLRQPGATIASAIAFAHGKLPVFIALSRFEHNVHEQFSTELNVGLDSG
jgi:hypothetical protein